MRLAIPLLIGFMSLSNDVAAQSTQDVSRPCTANEITRFENIEKISQGVAVTNPTQPKTGSMAAMRWARKNWIPLHTDKQLFCGTLHDFKYHNGLGKEMDWNLWTIPSADFTDILELGKENADPNQILKCGGKECLEGEVTPEDPFVNTRFFPRDGNSPLEGQEICMYGPWVIEWWHGKRPEIHPTEAVWWTDSATARRYVAFARDASKRFDSDNDFQAIGTSPKARPWAQPPLDSHSEITVKAPVGSVLNWSMSQDLPPVTPAPATRHTLSVKGQPVFHLENSVPPGSNFNVALQNACLDGTQVRATIQVTGKLSTGTKPLSPGFLLLSVGPLSAVPTNLPQSPTQPAIEIDVKSLRRSRVGGATTLVGEARIVGLPAGATISSVAVRDSSNPALMDERPQIVAGTNRIDQVPVLDGRTFSIQTATGVHEIEQKPIGITALIDEFTEGARTASTSGWNVIRKLLGAQLPAALPASLTVVRVPRWRLKISGAYGPLEDGQVAVEETALVPTALNDALTRNAPARLSLFGADRPWAAEWTTQEKTVNVTQTAADGPATTDLIVTFPSQEVETLQMATVRASIADPFGIKATASQEVASHALVAKDTAALANGLIQLVQPPNAKPGPNPRTDALRLGAIQSLAAVLAEDQLVTIPELRQLLKVGSYRR